MNPIDRIAQLTERAENAEKQADMALSNCEAAQRAVAELREENRQLRRSVDELRAQVETARLELAREAGTIALLSKDKRAAIELLRRAACYVQESGTLGPIGEFIPNESDRETQTACEIQAFLSRHA